MINNNSAGNDRAKLITRWLTHECLGALAAKVTSGKWKWAILSMHYKVHRPKESPETTWKWNLYTSCPTEKHLVLCSGFVHITTRTLRVTQTCIHRSQQVLKSGTDGSALRSSSALFLTFLAIISFSFGFPPLLVPAPLLLLSYLLLVLSTSPRPRRSNLRRQSVANSHSEFMKNV